jgi:PmbA protein
MDKTLQDILEITLGKLNKLGFDSSQVTLTSSTQDELNIAHNAPSLLRSTEDYDLSIMAIIDGRRANASLSDLSEAAIDVQINELLDRARLAPQDDANAVSFEESGYFERGPQQSELTQLTQKVTELLDYRQENTAKMSIDEGAAAHILTRECLLTSGGTQLSSSIGYYELMVSGTATDAGQCSSFNYTGGTSNDLSVAHAVEFFGIKEMLEDSVNQIHTQPLGDKFQGVAIFSPGAVTDILSWLLEQLSDYALIADSSIYKNAVNTLIASPLLSIQSCFDGPGNCAYNSDGFNTPALELVSAGNLGALLPSFYGSRKTGVIHTPVASDWSVCPGESSREELINSVQQGALINRLSMGTPSANGDFAAVMKNSFAIKDGKVGTAISESMVSGNMADMLRDISGVSAESIDYGSEQLPWIRVPSLYFS